ncbi:MAG: Flp family type IVb pilin [Acidobacteriaceae bacterium]|jgi:Flp pilus assembly pilin Flp|nr:Flp family type IVb pilin [Acidobacteriaceae bacterium]
MRAHIKTFIGDTRGQDLIEYALLTGLITSGLIAVFPAIQTALQHAFTTWGDTRSNLWQPPPPQ